MSEPKSIYPTVPAPPEPPEKYRWRVVKEDAVRAIFSGALAEIMDDFLEAQTLPWPTGSFNPSPISTTNTALAVVSAYNANLAAGELELSARVNDLPGFGDFFDGIDFRRS